MTKRLAILAMFFFLLLAAGFAQGEGADEDGFINPTRDPNAPEYFTNSPQELVPEQIVARSFILMERNTGIVLMQRNQDLQQFPASTSKIMTALIALQVGDLDATLEITENAMNIEEDASRVPFKQGEIVTLRDALYGLLLRSGNEAAIAIAEHIAGSEDLFVQQMNETARMLGCENTNFVNSHGYHHDLHQTTAEDLATIMDAALDNETFRQIIGTYQYELAATEKNPARVITNTNIHLNPDPENNYYYQYSIGGKTGYTSQAGYVLVEAAEKGGVELIAVAMYSGKYSRWPDTSRLFQYGFTQFHSATVEEIYNENPLELQLTGFSTEDTGLGTVQLSLKKMEDTRTIRFTDTEDNLKVLKDNYGEYSTVNWTVEPRAPVEVGQVMGTITFWPSDGQEPAEYELIATRAVAARLDAPLTLEEIEERVLADPSPFPPFDWDWFLPPVLGILGGMLLLRFLLKRAIRAIRNHKKIPTPKRRTFG